MQSVALPDHVQMRPSSLKSPAFDLLAFFAPAALGLAAFVAAGALGLTPLAILWIWIALFDGPHMLAAYTRTYGDPAMWQGRRRLLALSLVAFAVGPLLLLVAKLAHVPGLFTAFLALMTVYAYHHVVRQHWGFAAIYAVRGGSKPARTDRWALYLGCWLPYGYFLATHPSLRAWVQLPESIATPLSWLFVLGWVAIVLHRLATVFGGVPRARGRARWSDAYLLTAVAFHGFAYLFAARFEPMFRGAQGLDQEFMVLAAMSGIFHSAQYVALVALYHARSTRGGSAATWFGGIGAAAASGRLALVMLPFVGLYVGVACATGVYPGCGALASLGGTLGNELALGIWYGFALHHYWLDERIWRISRDPRLRAVFGL